MTKSATKTIQQTIEFKGTTPEEIFDIFMDSKKHGEIIGAEVKMGKMTGDEFTLFGGVVKGKNLLIVPKRLTVRAWRGNVWKKDDLDSIEIMVFKKTPSGAQIQLVHTVLPEQFEERWNELYWKPLKEYLKMHRK
jgi:activator of HSP90 ATPase